MNKKLTQLNEDDLRTKSQATYFFDCKGDGTSKGSFCCILKKGTEYFILTAGHNLQIFDPSDNVNNNTSEKTKIDLIQKYLKEPIKYNEQLIYKLKGSSEINLALVKDYRKDGYDAAILKIITPNITSTNFYKNTIEFGNEFCSHTGDFDYKNKSENTIKTKNGTYVGYSNKIKSDFKFLGYQDSEQLYYINDKGEDQMSGCCVFENENKNLLGLFKGEKNENGVAVTYFDLKLKESNYDII